AVVPGAQRKVKSEYPWQCLEPEMRKQQCCHDQRGYVNGEDAILVEVLLAMIGAIKSRHVMRIIEKQSKSIESDRPGQSVRGRDKVGEQQQRCRPRATAHHHVQPRVVNPQRGRRSAAAASALCHAYSRRQLRSDGRNPACADYRVALVGTVLAEVREQK